MLVDMSHFVEVDVEPHTQIVRPQHVVQVGNSREMLGCKPPVQCVQSLDATILTLDVGLHEADIGSKVLKESLCYGPAQNRYAHMGILVCKRVHYGHSHGHVTQCREPYDKDVFGFHFLLL